MKLPRTKYEPTIENGTPHGTPRMDVRVLAPGTYGGEHTAQYNSNGLNRPWPEPLTWGHADLGYYAPITIRNVPLICIMRDTSYDIISPLPNPNAPAWWQTAQIVNVSDYTAAIQPES